MSHDVFISYSSRDKPTADALCHTLDAAGVRCWMAPRDIQPGAGGRVPGGGGVRFACRFVRSGAWPMNSGAGPMRRHRRILALLLCWPCLLGAAAQVQAAPPSAGPEREDCRIFVVLGRALLGWGRSAPDQSQFRIFYRPEGAGYVQQCPWKRLGVTPPAATAPDPKASHDFTSPVYDHGGAEASVSYVTRLEGEHLFLAQRTCRLRKTALGWRLLGCTEDAIT
ncbi:MAG: hypothetical protein JWQ97_2181 [Phenylobacterium sp.]|nr:hypothetical protein [Phenylobacterium sp.]